MWMGDLSGEVSGLSAEEEEAVVCRSGGKSMSNVGNAGEAQGLRSGTERRVGWVGCRKQGGKCKRFPS